MTMMRKATLSLTYKGKDISKDISGHLISAEYTDNSSGKADDLQITMENRAGLWAGAWFPDKGAKVTAALTCENWRKPGDSLSLNMGTFEIDGIDFSGPPKTVTIKSMSSLVTVSFKGEARSRGWENVRLEAIAREIAERYGFTLFYDTDETIKFDRIDQNGVSDSGFLTDVCNKHGLTFKIAQKRLIIFEQKKYDAKPAVAVVEDIGGQVIDYRFSSESHNIYRACEVEYADPRSNEKIGYTFTPDDAPVIGSILKINKRVESLAAAQKLAKSELRNKNKNQFTGEMTLFGNPDLRGGVNIILSGYGIFDGKWSIEEAKHSIGSGYTTNVNIRKGVDY